MGNFALAAVLALLGAVASGQMTGTVFPTYTYKEAYTTTPSPLSTAISLSPHTSVSVQHTVVRNQPAYPFYYTDKKPDASEEAGYYYTYEESSSSEEKKGEGRRDSTTPIPSTTTTKKSPRSFWSSQKAQLDARRKETAQKFLNRPTMKPAEKTKVEFKVREKPKFGSGSKKESTTPPPTTTTTQKSAKFIYNSANLAEEKLSEKDEIKASKGVDTNQIVGRLGDIPVQNNNNKATAQILAPTVTPNVDLFGNSRNVNSNVGLRNNFNPRPLLDLNNKPSRPQQTLTKPEEFLINLTKQQPLLNLNSDNQQYPKPSLQNFQQPQITSNQQRLNNNPLLNLNQLPLPSNQQHLINSNPLPPLRNQQPLINSNSFPPLQNQQSLLNSNSFPIQNQQHLINSNPLPPLQNQQTLLNSNSLQQLTSNNSPFRAFISTSPTTNARTADYTNTNPSSTLLQRLGALGVNLANAADSGRSGLLVARDGGYGGGQGLTFNLGPVADPLQILLKLLTLIPRPLLDLNGRLFFGIELGKNAGLVSGAVHKPVVG